MVKAKTVCIVAFLLFAAYTAYLGINWAHGMGQKLQDRLAQIDEISAGR